MDILDLALGLRNAIKWKDYIKTPVKSTYNNIKFSLVLCNRTLHVKSGIPFVEDEIHELPGTPRKSS